MKPVRTVLSLALLAAAGPLTAAEWIGTREPIAGNAVYFVMTDRFVNGDKSNDQRDQGGKELHTFDRPIAGAPKGQSANIGYMGGDFKGLLDQADYIRGMGFGAVWLTPIVDNPNEAFTGSSPVQWKGFMQDGGKTGFHGYWGVNFYRLDEHWPSKGLDFKGLTQGLKNKGLLTVLDIVGNHGSPSFSAPSDRDQFGKLYDKDGRLVANTQNLEPAKLDPKGNPLHAFYHNTPDLVQLSNLDETNPAVVDYLVGAYLQWIDQGAAAFRVDTIRHMPSSFWKTFADRIRAEHPGFFMFGEAFDYDAANIAPYTWDANGNYSLLDFPLKKAMDETFAGKGAGFEHLLPALYLQDGPYANPYDLMTFYDNHDMPRMNATDTGFINANNWLFTARGTPVIYYGSEMRFERGKAEHEGNRNYYGTANIAKARQSPIYSNLRRIALVRKATPALQRGLQLNVTFKGDTAGFYRVLEAKGYPRQVALVALNKGKQSGNVRIPGSRVEGGRYRSLISGKTITLRAGRTASLPVAANGVDVWLKDGRVNNPVLRAELLRSTRNKGHQGTTPATTANNQ